MVPDLACRFLGNRAQRPDQSGDRAPLVPAPILRDWGGDSTTNQARKQGPMNKNQPWTKMFISPWSSASMDTLLDRVNGDKPVVLTITERDVIRMMAERLERLEKLEAWLKKVP